MDYFYLFQTYMLKSYLSVKVLGGGACESRLDEWENPGDWDVFL